jgi:hypothetical protein
MDLLVKLDKKAGLRIIYIEGLLLKLFTIIQLVNVSPQVLCSLPHRTGLSGNFQNTVY